MTKPKIDPLKIKIQSDPLPNRRAGVLSKYEKLLQTIQPGQNFVCEPNAVPGLSGALRKHIKDKKIKARIVTQVRGADGLGRIWLVTE